MTWSVTILRPEDLPTTIRFPPTIQVTTPSGPATMHVHMSQERGVWVEGDGPLPTSLAQRVPVPDDPLSARLFWYYGAILARTDPGKS